MPRYLVERTFPEGQPVPAGRAWLSVVEVNADEGVTWLHSYVSEDGRKTFCVYEAPTPEAVRKTAVKNDLPVDRITGVRLLDPFLYI